MSNLIKQLSELGILSQDRLELYYPRVRDRDDVSVLRDRDTEVIVLSGNDHMSVEYYETRPEKNSYLVHEQNVVTPRLPDNIRRAQDFAHLIRNKRWLDFGCGLGGMLDEMASEAAWAVGLEPSRERTDILKRKGHQVVQALDEIAPASLDVVTMFHVLEHLTDPLAELEKIKLCLQPGGRLLVEVPHARDALFSLYNSEAFKQFTFWSEHLVLHTRQSLALLLRAAGFSDIQVIGHQRYPLANHLYWLAKQCPGGHDVWSVLNTPGLQVEYESTLSKLDRTDTLIAVCGLPS